MQKLLFARGVGTTNSQASTAPGRRKPGGKRSLRRVVYYLSTAFLATAGLAIVATSSEAAAPAIPVHVFAPYFESWNGDSAYTISQQSGAKYLTMAFLQTASSGSCTAYWDGSTSQPVSSSVFGSDISNIQAAGGNVIPSFGGYTADTTNTDIADSCTNVSSIAQAYESLVTTYNVTRIDLDVEQNSLTNSAGVTRRNQAIAQVESWAASTGRTVQFSYTLPTNTNGLDSNGLAVLQNAVSNNAVISVVNIMTFDYYTGNQEEMATDTETAAQGLYNQLGSLYPGKSAAQLWGMIGVTDMMGIDDAGTNETFTTTDAPTVESWAASRGLGELSYWAVQRDNGGCPGTAGSGTCSGVSQSTWYFDNQFEPFTSGSTAPEAPFGGTPAAVPGTVEAANYDTGGQSVAYNVSSVNGSANSYRSDGVDLETTSDTQGTSGTGAAYDLGWTTSGQWFKYTVNVASAGTYTVSLRLAAPSAVTDGLHIANTSGTNLSGNINVPSTGGWQTWTTVTASVTLPAGTQTLSIDQDNGGWNVHYLSFASNEGPFGGTPAAVPGTVEAANYDTGGQGVAYNVSSVNGSANSYRSDGVDLETTSDTQGTSGTGAAYDLGWTTSGQWFKYTVNVASAGTYTVSLRLAAPSAVTDGLHIANASGTNLSGNINVPATGGYQTWTTVTASITLPAGTQTLSIDQDNAGWNVHYLSFASASGINSSAWYEVVNENSGLCASAANGSTANGTAVEQLACTGASSQLWQFVNVASGEYEVLNQAGQSGAEAWNITGGVTATANGALLQTWSYGGTSNTNALFAAKSVSNGYYNLVADNSGLCIDTPGASMSGGVQLQQYTCNGTSAQEFSLTVPPSGPPSNPFGANVYVFDPSMSASSIQGTLNNVFNTQQSNQFGTQRYALLFAPGAYNVTANIGFYTSIMGLGLSPDAVDLTGNLSVDAQWNGGNATENFWRSASNFEVTPSNGAVTWAVAQAGPFRRMDVQGNMNLYPTAVPNSCCSGWASGGYISDSRVTGQVNSGGQQQWISRNSQFGSWTGSNYNMVFSGVQGAPAQSFPNPAYTVLGTSPVTREEPFLYLDSSYNYHVFVPSVQQNSAGLSWANGQTPGTSLPLSSFFIATPANSAAQINTALAAGQNLLFTPGVYNINQTLQVSKADTVVMGMGLPTLIPQGGVDTMHVADAPGVNISGILFDAGSQTSNALLTVGTQGSSANYSSDPVTVQDDFFRIGGDIAASATTSLIDNSNYSIIDDIWAWRADHGNSGTVGWTVNPASTGLVVNGNNVTAYGLFVEHYEQTEIIWNGQNGEDIFLQNENPYDPPSQSAWMDGSQNGYPALYVNPSVTNFQGYGLGSYCFFNQGVNIHNAMAFQVPQTSGVQFHDMVTIFLTGSGGIDSIINGTGGAVSSSNTKSVLTSYP